MQAPNDKLDISAISFDDMLGDGLETAPQEVEEQEPTDVKEVEEEDYDDEETYGDEDREDGLDEDYDDNEDESLTVEDELPIADQISEVLGLELEAEYDDTVEGLTNYVRDISQEVAEEQLQSLFDEFPEVQRHLDYVLAGGDPEQFYATNSPQSDYGNIQMSEQDITLQRAMLGEYFKAKGHQDDFIVDMLNDYEESGKLYGKARAAQEQLSIAQQAQKERLYEEQMELQQEVEAEQEEFWDAVANTIEDGNCLLYTSPSPRD